MTHLRRSPDDRAGPYELFMLGLSVYVLAALAAEVLLPLDAATRQILGAADTAICAIFFADFCRSLYRAESKLGYMKWGWIDLLSSIPALDAARWGRLARVVRIFRLLRGARSLSMIAAYALRRRAEAAFMAVALVSILLVVFSSVAILQLETHPDRNIKTPSDALWWSFATITTVGYGDRYPVTTEGRLVAAMLMTAGVGLFGTFTGFVASWFTTPAREKEAEIAEVRAAAQDRVAGRQSTEIALLREELAELRAELRREARDEPRDERRDEGERPPSRRDGG